MFWGANLKQGSQYNFTASEGKLLHISNMSLGKNADEGKIYVNFTNSNKETFVLGSLQNNKCESIQTDLYIKIQPNMNLFLTGGTGKAQVSVTGFWEGSDELSSEGEEQVSVNKKQNHTQERKVSVDKVVPRKDSVDSKNGKNNADSQRKESVDSSKKQVAPTKPTQPQSNKNLPAKQEKQVVAQVQNKKNAPKLEEDSGDDEDEEEDFEGLEDEDEDGEDLDDANEDEEEGEEDDEIDSDDDELDKMVKQKQHGKPNGKPSNTKPAEGDDEGCLNECRYILKLFIF